MRFSERMGYRKPKPMMGREEVSKELCVRLWNLLRSLNLADAEIGFHSSPYHPLNDGAKLLFRAIWDRLLKEPVDELEQGRSSDLVEKLKNWVLDSSTGDEWFRVYDFIEFFADHTESVDFIQDCNAILEEEKSPYRFIRSKLAPISNETEIAEIEKAQSGPDVVADHMTKAVTLYADRQEPDYRNAVKEAVSAVEAAARLMLGNDKATLGEAMKRLKADGKTHPAFSDGVSKIYGWSSDTVRHAARDGQADIGEPEARFMLVSCSAMANFLLSGAGG